MTFHFVDNVEQVFELALEAATPAQQLRAASQS